MRMFSTCSPPNTALRNCTNGTCYLLTPGGNRQLYHRLHQIQAKTSNKTKYKNSTASVPTPPLLRLEVHFSSKTVLRGHRHVLGHAPALGTPHVWHLRPPRGGQKRPTGLGGTSAPLSAAPAPPPGGAVPEGRLPPPGPPYRRCQSGPGPRGASGRAGPGGRRTESHLLRRCPAGGLRLFPARWGTQLLRSRPRRVRAAQGSSQVLPVALRRGGCGNQLQHVRTVSHQNPPQKRGENLSELGKPGPPSRRAQGSAFPGARRGPRPFPALPCPALPCPALRCPPDGPASEGDPWGGGRREITLTLRRVLGRNAPLSLDSRFPA